MHADLSNHQDTAGETEVNYEEAFRACDGFVLMYSITQRKSLDYLDEVVRRIRGAKGRDVDKNIPVEELPMVIVANKVDRMEGISLFLVYLILLQFVQFLRPFFNRLLLCFFI